MASAFLPIFTEAGWEKARPHFEDAWKKYKEAGFTFSEFVHDLQERYGFDDTVLPYLDRLRRELNAQGLLINDDNVKARRRIPAVFKVWIYKAYEKTKMKNVILKLCISLFSAGGSGLIVAGIEQTSSDPYGLGRGHALWQFNPLLIGFGFGLLIIAYLIYKELTYRRFHKTDK